MATATKISSNEYRLMTFPDRAWPELADGELRERSVPTSIHQWIEKKLVGALDRVGLFAFTELHLVLRDGEYRVADTAAFVSFPQGDWPASPPIVTVEIISRTDVMREAIAKCREYRDWGVENVWLVEPANRALYVYGATGLHEVEAFELPAYNLRITLDELLAGIPPQSV